jgi:hypothetical protein
MIFRTAVFEKKYLLPLFVVRAACKRYWILREYSTSETRIKKKKEKEKEDR